MKIFNDHKASKLFTDAYNNMDPMTRSLFGERARALADKKLNSEPGEYKEFYLTVKDVKYLIKSIRPLPL